MAKDLRDRLQQAIDRGESIWTVGDIQQAEGQHTFNQITAMLRRNFEISHPQRAPEGVFLLTPKRD